MRHDKPSTRIIREEVTKEKPPEKFSVEIPVGILKPCEGSDFLGIFIRASTIFFMLAIWIFLDRVYMFRTFGNI